MAIKHGRVHCQVCGNLFQLSQVVPVRFIRPAIIEMMEKNQPNWTHDGAVCQDDLNHYRNLFVQDVLRKEKGELSDLENDVLKSIKEQDILSQNLNKVETDEMTLGQRLADKVASFGGSWPFIIIFGGILLVWIAVNSGALLARPFDPFPFILLNLVLSCLAAIQAPVIMMSQNRQQLKDRLSAENDYKINLKAELEIRHLHSKLDLMLTHQWQRLMEIQQVQTDLLEELSKKRPE